MLGAIIGDIVGSIYENHNFKSKEFELFGEKNFFTDDSVLTLATAAALVSNHDFSYHYRIHAKNYPDRGYGSMFIRWAHDESMGPYWSLGNGSAMRVSPVAHYAKSLEECLCLAKKSAEVTHNHPEGIMGAVATAGAIFHAINGASLVELNKFWDQFPYDLSKSTDEVRPFYRIDETCHGTLPVAFRCVLESTSFEDCLRLGVSVGGDTDTICTIAGSIAEGVFGIPNEIKEKALNYLPSELRDTMETFNKSLKKS